MTIYIDKLFLINFCLSYLILLVTKKFLKNKTNNPRIFIGSIIASVYTVFMFIPNVGFLYTFFGKLVFSLILVAITYHNKTIKSYIKTIIAFYVITFVFGGCAYAIMNFISTKEVDIISIKILISATVIAYFLLNIFERIYKVTKCTNNSMIKITVKIDDKHKDIDGIIDTGNSLLEPISGRPVIVVSYESIKEILSKKYIEIIDEMRINTTTDIIHYNRLRIIPYNSVGKNNGFIFGIIPNEVWINQNKVECVIGINKSQISADKSYEALVNPMVI